MAAQILSRLLLNTNIIKQIEIIANPIGRSFQSVYQPCYPLFNPKVFMFKTTEINFLTIFKNHIDRLQFSVI
jgi:hypothetical protein